MIIEKFQNCIEICNGSFVWSHPDKGNDTNIPRILED